MSIRPLLFLSTVLLLAACASEPPPPAAPAPVRPAPAKVAASVVAPLPAHMRELTGSLSVPPSGSEVEMALLVVDERDRPQQLLASLKLAGTGQDLAFHLPFNPEYFPGGARVELRARVSLSGRLIQHLPAQRIAQAQTQNLGQLRLVSAP
ncbi:MAG TPA: YbaY family lipoprotein [Pseudomonas sp.]|nr:YbaY family lipoprotein [Pseudomonas sp.]